MQKLKINFIQFWQRVSKGVISFSLCAAFCFVSACKHDGDLGYDSGNIDGNYNGNWTGNPYQNVPKSYQNKSYQNKTKTTNRPRSTSSNTRSQTRRSVPSRSPSSRSPSPALRNSIPNIPRAIPPGANISYSRVSTSMPILAMTFDDGPHPSHTPRLLSMLGRRNIRATFFVIGKNVKAYPHIIRRMVAEGHEIGNHTYTHPSLTKLSRAAVDAQLARTADAIYNACGRYPRTMRPPFGATNTSLKRAIFERFGYPTILWSVDPKDWQRPGISVVRNRVIRGANRGAIILVHDIHKPSVDAMPGALDGILQRGYQFVTISQLINNRAMASKSSSPSGKGVRNTLTKKDEAKTNIAEDIAKKEDDNLMQVADKDIVDLAAKEGELQLASIDSMQKSTAGGASNLAEKVTANSATTENANLADTDEVQTEVAKTKKSNKIKKEKLAESKSVAERDKLLILGDESIKLNKEADTTSDVSLADLDKRIAGAEKSE